ncbi:MAG TPA: protein kinase [Ktedonobacterales bacterium]|nr:protein kinase [Ktedonobacterales bacterium]
MAQDGQEIAGYKLIKKVGEGGMGQVFLAEQLRLRRQVAIKLVHLDVKPENGAEPADELTREAEALMALEHPHILSLYDAGRSEDTAYLVMPYLPEGSLQDALRPGQRQQLQLPLPPGEALIYVEQAAAALQYAHDRNFIHRDVKPANFLIRSLSRTTGSGRGTKRLHLFLADFGLSKFLAYSSNTTHLSGTPTYMAPEQFQGHATPASDQYSLAILFFYLLTGDLPYRGSPVELMFHHLSDTPPSPASRVEGIPESLANVVQRGMAKTPEERYPSVSAMAEAAHEALVEAGLLVSQESMPVSAVRPSDLQTPNSNPPASLGPTAALEPPTKTPESVLEASTITPAATVSTDDLVTSRGPAAESAPAAPAKPAESSFGNLPTIAGKSDQGSLPTIAIEDHKPPARPPRDEGPAPAGRRSRSMVVGLSVVAAIILIGVVLGSGVLLQLGPFHKNAPATQATQAPTATSTGQPTATATPIPSPTAIPAGDLLNAILAQNPSYTVDLTQGNTPWDGPTPINPHGTYNFNSPGGSVVFLNGIITYNAHNFSTPFALSVKLQAPSDRQFYILLDTTNPSGAHHYYRLQLTNNAAPQAADSTDNKTFKTDGTATSPNTTWGDGNTHTLILVLDKTRLVFYLDGTPLIDTTIPQPYPTAILNLATLDQATITSIKAYNIPAGD